MNVAWRMVAFPCDEHIATPPVFTHLNITLPYKGTLRNRTSKHSNRPRRERSPASAPCLFRAGRVQRVFGGPRAQTQFAVLSPTTLWKCLVLMVTKVRLSDNAWAAMRVSNVPIGSPRFAKALATGPNRSAAA